MTPSKERNGSPKRPNWRRTKYSGTPSPLRGNSEESETPLLNRPGVSVFDNSYSSRAGPEALDMSWTLPTKVTWPKGQYWLLCHKISKPSAVKQYSYARHWFTHLEDCEKCQDLLEVEQNKHRREKGEFWTPCHISLYKNRRTKPFSYARCWLQHMEACDYCSELSLNKYEELSLEKYAEKCRDGKYWSLCSSNEAPYATAHAWYAHLKDCADCKKIWNDEQDSEWEEGEYWTLCRKSEKPLPYLRCWLEHLENCEDCESILENEQTYAKTIDDSPPTLKRVLSMQREETDEEHSEEDEDEDEKNGSDDSQDKDEPADGPKPVLDEQLSCPHQAHRRIQEKIRENLTSKDERGYIYILYNPEDNLRKIGRSVSVAGRKMRIEYDCKIDAKFEFSHGVAYYKRTESLVHAELEAYRRSFTCEICGKTHREWYKIDETKAKESVQMWIDFINLKPYDNDSNELQEFWMYRTILREEIIKFDELNKQIRDMQSLRLYWSRILSPPSTYDHLGYKLEMICRYLKKDAIKRLGWKTNALAAWIIATVLTLQRGLYSIVFVGIAFVISIVVFVSGEYNGYQEFHRRQMSRLYKGRK